MSIFEAKKPKYNSRHMKYRTSKEVHRAYILCLREIEEVFGIDIPQEVLETLVERLNRVQYGNYDQKQFDNLFDKEFRVYKKAVRQWEESERMKYKREKARKALLTANRKQAYQEKKYQQWLLDWSIFK